MSGSKTPGIKDLLSIGSTEDFDVSCDPCKFLDKIVEAKEFCVNCQENLCKRCVEAHKSTKASRHHRLSDQPQKVTRGTSVASDPKICTEYCNIHKKEVIKFFCSRHDTVGCTDCMTLDHRTCNIDFIPDVCCGILKSKEFCGTLQNVSRTLKDVKLIEEKVHSKKYNKTSVAEVVQEIEKFQKKMNDRIEQLKQELVKEANSYKSNQEQEVEQIANSCARVYSELKQVHTTLTDCQTNQLDVLAFVIMKKAQCILSSTKFQSFEEDLTVVLKTISFEPNNELETILSKQYGLGRIVLPISDVNKTKPKVKSTDAGVTAIQESSTVLNSIKQKKTINVKAASDLFDCCISGCAVISSDRLLLVDYWNYKLKIVNTDIHSIVQEMAVVPGAYDVTVLPQDQVAVTLPFEEKILILGTAGKLKWIRSMTVGRRCWGIAYHQDCIYLVCQEPNSLLVLDMLGNVQRDIPLQTAQDQSFRFSSYIAVGKDGHSLYISDSQSHFVSSLTLEGHVTGVYKHHDLNDPRGLVVLDDGSLLVCSPLPGTIHHISADLKQGRTLIRDVSNVESICCHPSNQQIFAGAQDKDFSVFDYE